MNGLPATIPAAIVALAMGLAIGMVFGFVEGRLRKARRQSTPARPSFGPGSGALTRIACLLLALALLQLACPHFFSGGFRWIVSAGLLVGYGLMFGRSRFNKRAN